MVALHPAVQAPPALRPAVLDHEAELVSKVARHWMTRLAPRAGFPRNYTAIDLETNGVDPENDHLCCFGYAVVRDGAPAAVGEIVLNWPGHLAGPEQADFLGRLDRCRYAMLDAGKDFYHDRAYLESRGVAPGDGLERILGILEACRQYDEVIVAHNGYRFDAEFLQAAFHNVLGVGHLFHENEIYDSGVIEKASQLADSDCPIPGPDESFRDWAARIGGLRRKGVRWALDSHCEARYRLSEKAAAYGPAYDHVAWCDALKLHYLVAEQARLAAAAA
jgi:hypothetical protein